MSVPSFLRRLSLFSTLDDSELAMLKDYVHSKRLAPGEVLFREGEKVTRCFVIVSGTLGVFSRLSNGKEERLADAGPGAIMGNMALIDHKPSNTTCRAGKQPVFLVVLEQSVFERLFRAESPFAYKILDRITYDLTGKLRCATSILSKISEDGIAKRTRDARNCARSAAKELIDSQLADVGLTESELDEIQYVIKEA